MTYFIFSYISSSSRHNVSTRDTISSCCSFFLNLTTLSIEVAQKFRIVTIHPINGDQLEDFYFFFSLNSNNKQKTRTFLFPLFDLYIRIARHCISHEWQNRRIHTQFVLLLLFFLPSSSSCCCLSKRFVYSNKMILFHSCSLLSQLSHVW